MKKLVLYALLLGAVLLTPEKGVDVGKLLPVELVKLDREKDHVVIITDVGATGKGTTVEAAVENMHETTDRIVFLDTADFLLLTDAARQDFEAVKEYLKKSVRVCNLNEDIELQEAAIFLEIHKPKYRLRDWKAGSEAELLTKEDGRLILKEK